MIDKIKELLNSTNTDDIRLGLEIARNLNISPKKINDIFDNLESHMINLESVDDIFDEYLERILPGYKDNHIWDYIKWKS